MFIVGPVERGEVAEVARMASGSLPENVPPTWIMGAVERDPESVLVARDLPSNRVVGFAVSARQAPCEGSLLALAVSRHRRNEGIGSALVGCVRDRMVRAGALHMNLHVRVDDDRAKRFYLRHGFAPEGLEPHAYSDGADAVRLGRPL